MQYTTKKFNEFVNSPKRKSGKYVYKWFTRLWNNCGKKNIKLNHTEFIWYDLCGCLKENGNNRFINYQKVYPGWNIYDLVRGSLSLGTGIEVSHDQFRPSVISLFQLPHDPDIEILVPSPTPSLPTCYYASCHEKWTTNIWIISYTQWYIFLYKMCLRHGISPQQ